MLTKSSLLSIYLSYDMIWKSLESSKGTIYQAKKRKRQTRSRKVKKKEKIQLANKKQNK